MPQELLRLPEVIQRTGLARASIYAAIKRGEFPKSIQLGPRAVAWPSEDIGAWIAARIEASRKAQKTAMPEAAARQSPATGGHP